MKQYVVKNCPLYTEIDNLGNTCASLYTCESDTDCLIKQIIEKCKKAQNIYNVAMNKNELADEILEFFSIQEVK